MTLQTNTMSENQNQNQDEPPVPSICSVCHSEPPINAVQLDCGHIFCFLCAKSANELTGICPLCRREIGIEFNFKEHDIIGPVRMPKSKDGFYWFYEGFRGWWLYDADTCGEIEDTYQRGVHTVEKFMAGAFYVIDLMNMIQRRKDGDGKSRKICRATLEVGNILGMAGIKGKDFSNLLEMMKWHDSMQRAVS